MREGSKSASNELCARAEANAEDMYQLELGPDGPPPATERAFWRKVARDLSTTNFDYNAGKHHPKKPTWMEGLTIDESITLEVDVACGVSPSGSVVCQPHHLTLPTTDLLPRTWSRHLTIQGSHLILEPHAQRWHQTSLLQQSGGFSPGTRPGNEPRLGGFPGKYVFGQRL